MIILRQSEEAQTVKFIPSRLSNANKLVLTNETTNEVVNYDIECFDESFYKTFTQILNLEQDHFYTADFFLDDVLAHKDRVFCTNQDVDTFSVNNGVYVAKTSNIIFYE